MAPPSRKLTTTASPKKRREPSPAIAARAIVSNVVHSDSDSSEQESLLNFAMNSSMGRELQARLEYKQANRGKAKVKPFRPPPRNVDEDAEMVDPEEVRAREWRPKEGQFQAIIQLAYPTRGF